MQSVQPASEFAMAPRSTSRTISKVTLYADDSQAFMNEVRRVRTWIT